MCILQSLWLCVFSLVSYKCKQKICSAFERDSSKMVCECYFRKTSPTERSKLQKRKAFVKLIDGKE